MKVIDSTYPPEIAFNHDSLVASLQLQAGFPAESLVLVKKRSIDARGRDIKVNVQAQLFEPGEKAEPISYSIESLPYVGNKPQAVIVGAGPAGLFAALRLIELGIKPIVIERGTDVRTRRRDLAAINKDHIVNPESNYCFGEGGAGTYSDGKLYTRSKKRGDINRVLEILVAHGATHEILYDAHPHIGTNKLPKIVAALRETIREKGGEVLFDTRVDALIIENRKLKGIITHTGKEILGIATILATGHSARDVFKMLQKQEVFIEAKPFALGTRVEHQQSLIDRAQYHRNERGEYLPAASYSLVQQVGYNGLESGVFSFCMCPGGFIVPAATAPGELVVNGMSPSRRDSVYANSGIVVAVNEPDWQHLVKEHGPLAAMALQAESEQRACAIAGGTQLAPAQRLVDFAEGRVSKTLLETSYQPGLASIGMEQVLPAFVHKRLQTAFRLFGNKIKGYYTNEAQVVGVESRTSSPVRIPRHKETLQHLEIEGLYPCGEGAGYAGGIMSAAMDGERCAEALAGAFAGKGL